MPRYWQTSAGRKNACSGWCCGCMVITYVVHGDTHLIDTIKTRQGVKVLLSYPREPPISLKHDI
jgi:hypothetical protein